MALHHDGVAYVGAGLVIWRDARRGRPLAGAIAFLNLVVLVAIFLIHRTGGDVADDSVRAMTFRTVVWIGLFVVTYWIHRKSERVAPTT